MGGSGGTANGGAGNAGGGTPGCPATYQAEPQPGSVLFVVDRSGGYPPESWDELTVEFETLFDAFPTQLEAAAIFYPHMDDAYDTCGYSDALHVGFSAGTSLATAFMEELVYQPGGFATGGVTLREALASMRKHDAPGQRYVVLVSSGLVNRCWIGQGSHGSVVPDVGAASDDDRIVTAAFVITQRVRHVPYGDIDPYAELSSIASAGGAERFSGCRTTATCLDEGSCCYRHTSELTEFLDLAAGKVRPCVFKIPVGARSDQLVVEAAGNGIPRGEVDGWEFTTDSREAIRLSGAACDAANNASSNVVLSIPCEP